MAGSVRDVCTCPVVLSKQVPVLGTEYRKTHQMRPPIYRIDTQSRDKKALSRPKALTDSEKYRLTNDRKGQHTLE